MPHDELPYDPEEQLLVLEHQLECLRNGMDTDALGNDLEGMTERAVRMKIQEIQQTVSHEYGWGNG